MGIEDSGILNISGAKIDHWHHSANLGLKWKITEREIKTEQVEVFHQYDLSKKLVYETSFMFVPGIP